MPGACNAQKGQYLMDVKEDVKSRPLQSCGMCRSCIGAGLSSMIPRGWFSPLIGTKGLCMCPIYVRN